ncbi:uncharacterized protein N7503_005242 [Penicillium pulvis]|uniref:uncharacterized protein n=1 Tax=Penicillium pulvis TaxID=1562058 RepID=UPI0025491D56|nr:uncharacterized protein N7503_005242 [Penicillium pulvis]KAJ5802792.1 hypothetical protein N7503_005242 [Penicillium pulvis]
MSGVTIDNINTVMEVTSIPSPPTVGGSTMEPGEWAHRAKAAYWLRSRSQILKNGTLLHTMSDLPLLREPALRPPGHTKKGNLPWTGYMFDGFIAQKKCNAEALLAQSTGKLLENSHQCTHCQRGIGVFDRCVRVPGESYCANCHLCGYKDRCSLQEEPNPPLTIESLDLDISHAKAQRSRLEIQRAEIDALIQQKSQEIQALEERRQASQTRHWGSY